MSKELAPQHGQFLVYETEDGRIKLDVRFEGETAWLTQGMMAELFQTSVPNISMHIQNIFEEEELRPEATVKNFLTVRQEGGKLRADYGKALITTLAHDLSLLHGKGFSHSNLVRFQQFYLAFPKGATLSHQLTWPHRYVDTCLPSLHRGDFAAGQELTRRLREDSYREAWGVLAGNMG